ncbi:MAG TPA: hypothetical protein VLI41_07350 [Phenylobacterium sp.]|uniref:hypothetical protein n=1 Tax=Phenylobacterium sp. TaxID=1871053 RepID=UPI002BC33F0C|nr:hypothetical protein [Phenylobacterium sp.]HSV03009.1 hypothetical protein [Phenylobacterium sp.]
MPMLQTYLAQLNREFHPDRIGAFKAQRQQHFAPGRPLDLAFLGDEKTPLGRAWKTHFETIPESLREAIRGVIHSALAADPPIPLTFAWAPGYDYELNVWHAPDTDMTRGGITMLIKTRYPADRHPQDRAGRPAS